MRASIPSPNKAPLLDRHEPHNFHINHESLTRRQGSDVSQERRMSYRISPDAVVPLLARCLVTHGSMEYIQNYITEYSQKGLGDATVIPEFIATYEISKIRDSATLIAQAQAMADEAIETTRAESVGPREKELHEALLRMKKVDPSVPPRYRRSPGFHLPISRR